MAATTRASASSPQGLQRDADLLLALVSGDSDAISAQLADRGDLSQAALPVFQAAVIGGSPEAVALLAAAGAPPRTANAPAADLLPSKELVRLLESRLGPGRKKQARMTAPQLAAVRVRDDLLAALRAAGINLMAQPAAGQASRSLPLVLAEALSLPLAHADSGECAALAEAAMRSFDVMLECQARPAAAVAAAALLLVGTLQRRQHQEEQRDGDEGRQAAGSSQEFAAAARSLLRWMHRRSARCMTTEKCVRQAVLAATALQEASALDFAADSMVVFRSKTTLAEILAASDSCGFLVQQVPRLQAGSAQQRALCEQLACAAARRGEPALPLLQACVGAGVPISMELLRAAVAGSDLSALRWLLSCGRPLPKQRTDGGSGAAVAVLGHHQVLWLADGGSPRYPCCPIWNAIASANDEYDESTGQFEAVDVHSLQAVELLAAAGYRPTVWLNALVMSVPPRRYPLFNPAIDDPGIDTRGRHRLLWMAANRGSHPWTPATHHLFPPGFKAAVRALLLAAHRGSSQQGKAGAAGLRQRGPGSAVGTVAAAALGRLPEELLQAIIGGAAYPLSAWCLG